MMFKEGDYFYCVNLDDDPKTYSVFHCLRRDNENEIAHVTAFEPVPRKPSEKDIAALDVLILHAPIHNTGFDDPIVFADRTPTEDDLQGYLTYLKQNDFGAYLEESGAKAEDIIERAQEQYDTGNNFMDAENFQAAADFYEQALEIFPPFFEAADNQGFAYMDLGDPESAIASFERSIEINGHTFLTDFSICECYAQLDDIEQAVKWLNAARALPGLTEQDLALVAEYEKGFN